MNSLFRREVETDASDDRSLLAPRGQTLAIGLAVTTTFILLAWVFLGSYTRRVTVTGILEPAGGLTRIHAPRSDRIEKIHVAIGGIVEKDDPLLTLKGDFETEGGNIHVARIRQLNEDRSRLHRELESAADSFDEQKNRLLGEQQAIEEKLKRIAIRRDLQKEQSALKKDLLDRMRPLLDKGYVSPIQYKEREAEFLASRAGLESLETEYIDAKQLKASVASRLQLLPDEYAGKVGLIKDRISHVDQTEIQIGGERSLVIRSPVNGTIANLFASEGSHVSASQNLVNIVPGDGELVARLSVASDAVGFLKEGGIVTLRYSSFPYQKFGMHEGTIIHIPSSAMTVRDTPHATPEGTADLKPFYRVDIRLPRQDMNVYGTSVPLMAGMAVTADLMLERRRLIEWIFEPFIGLSKRMKGSKEAA